MAFRGLRQIWRHCLSVLSASTTHCHQSCSVRVVTLCAHTADQSCSSAQPAEERSVGNLVFILYLFLYGIGNGLTAKLYHMQVGVYLATTHFSQAHFHFPLVDYV